ncbi:MAG TPA: hypothetical protein VFZ13_05135 [Gemmatimonadales bacterium]
MNMLTVFVNERSLAVPEGSVVADAVAALDPLLAERVAAGGGYVTDARGIEIAADAVVRAGAILRVVTRGRPGTDADG